MERKIRIIKKAGTIKPATVNKSAHLVVSRKKDQVVFEALNINATIFFPNPILTYDKKHLKAPEQVIKVSTVKRSKDLFVHKSAKEGEEYFYTIWVDEDNDFVDVGSYPSVIIDP